MLNDLYVADIASASPSVPGSWQLISPAADPTTGAVAGYPSGRIGYTWTPFEIGAILFGGLSNNVADGGSGNPEDCFVRPPTPMPASCFWHYHVHRFTPGSGRTDISNCASSAAGCMPASAWVNLAPGTVPGGAVPAGRMQHSAGAMGDQLFVYGGITATGMSSELWSYNLVSQTWALINQGSVTPPSSNGGNGGFGAFSTATVIGHSVYAWVQQFDRNAPQAASGQLWKWQPSIQYASSNAAAGSSDVNSSIATGHTAGIVLGLLLGLANLYYLYCIAENASVNVAPSCLSRIPVVGDYFSGSSSPKAAGGFYSSSSNAASGSGYSAPPEL